jgi:uncharacterized peroxidase-related enzyme
MERLVPVNLNLGQLETPPVPSPSWAELLPECNFLQLLANSPSATQGYLAFESALAHGRLTPRQREAIALIVAEINGSKYGLSAHYAAAKKAGLTDGEIQLARKASSPDAKTMALLRFTRAVTLQRGEVSDADFQPLRKVGFTDVEIPEIVANIALNIFTNYFNNAIRSVVDFPLLQPGVDLPATPSPACGPKELAI